MRTRLLLFFIFFGSTALAQVVTETTYLERYAHPQKSPFTIQLMGGLTGLNTSSCSLFDVADQNFFFKPNLSLGVGYQLTHRIGFQLKGAYYRHSCKVGAEVPDFDGVKSDNFEGTLSVKHYLFPLKHFDEYYRRFNYYAIAGAGLLYLNPRDANTGERLASAEGFDQITWVVPVGLGTEFRVTNFFIMALEAKYHFTGTDYLDGIALHAPNSNHGRDHYVGLSAGIIFRIPHNEYKYEDFLKLKKAE
jgi:hypothetical protein